MSSLKIQKRLAASVLNCGKKKVWLDPTETEEISQANSRHTIRKLVKHGLIIKKPNAVQSRWRYHRRILEKKSGRHTGPGKRRGTANARQPVKRVWIRKVRVLRRMLKRLKIHNKIDSVLYREFYGQIRGNVFRSKHQMGEVLHLRRFERKRAKAIEDQSAARLKRARRLVLQREERKAMKDAAVLKEREKEDLAETKDD